MACGVDGVVGGTVVGEADLDELVAAVVRVGGGVAVFVGEYFGVAAVEVGEVLLGVGFVDFQKAVDF